MKGIIVLIKIHALLIYNRLLIFLNIAYNSEMILLTLSLAVIPLHVYKKIAISSNVRKKWKLKVHTKALSVRTTPYTMILLRTIA